MTQALLNGIYVKAQQLDRGHNAWAPPAAAPAGATRTGEGADAQAHANAFSPGEDALANQGRGALPGADVATHASTHASDF